MALAVAAAAAIGLAAARTIGAEQAVRVGAAGVTVALPPGWHALPISRLHERTDPVRRVAVASGPIQLGRGCNELDLVFPPTAVAVVVLEWVRGAPRSRFPPRPGRFDARNLRVSAPPAVECFRGPAGEIEFAQHGRRFAAFVLVGTKAPRSLASRARAVLDTLVVQRSR